MRVLFKNQCIVSMFLFVFFIKLVCTWAVASIWRGRAGIRGGQAILNTLCSVVALAIADPQAAHDCVESAFSRAGPLYIDGDGHANALEPAPLL